MTNPLFRSFIALLAVSPLVAQQHPYFNDGGALAWHGTLAAAKAAASKSDKLIFVQYGRKACGNCRALTESVLPADAIKKSIGELAIGYAVDCDAAQTDVDDLLRTNLPNAQTLPFVAFLTPTGEWINGAAGYQKVEAMAALLAEASKSPLLEAKPDVRAALAKPAAGVAAAADKADWKTVLAAARVAKQSVGRCPERTAILAAEKKARDHAAAEFAAVMVAAADSKDLAPLRKRVTALKAPFAGEPEGADCDVGLKALQKLQFVRDAEARGNVAKDLRSRTAAEFQGSRWIELFGVPAPAGEGKSPAEKK